MKTLIWKDTCTSTFIAALSIIAKTGKQPNCPSTGEWTKKIWCTYTHIYVKVAQLCLTLCDPIDCSLPGSSVHGILQTRILEWVAVPVSRGTSWPRNRTSISCIAGGFFTSWATREACTHRCACTHTHAHTHMLTHMHRHPHKMEYCCCCCCYLVTKLCQLFATPSCQAPLLMGFPRQEYNSGLHFLLQGIFLTQGLNSSLLLER